MSNLYNVIKSNKIDNNTDVGAYVDILLRDGKTYIGMVYDKKSSLLELPKGIKEGLFEFRYLRNEQVYEILLSWFKVYKLGKLKEQLFIKSLKRLWVFVVRAKFVSINPSDYEKIFSQHCSAVVSSEDILKDINLLFDKLKPLVNNKQQFLDNLLSDVKYGRDNKIITKIYADLMLEDDPEIKQSNPEIEHILPQVPIKWGLEKIDTKDYVNKIGNLTLLFGEYNKEVGNEKIDKKKVIFDKSNFKINKEIASRWSDKFSKNYKTAIDDRGLKVAEQIEELWSL